MHSNFFIMELGFPTVSSLMHDNFRCINECFPGENFYCLFGLMDFLNPFKIYQFYLNTFFRFTNKINGLLIEVILEEIFTKILQH